MENEGFKIMIADDDIDDQRFLKLALQELGSEAETTSVYNGVQLLDLLYHRENFRSFTGLPDLILLDINMPLLDGFGALREIRKHEEWSGIPVYVLSTSQAAPDRKKALELGATGYYSKPASFKDLKVFVGEIRNCQVRIS